MFCGIEFNGPVLPSLLRGSGSGCLKVRPNVRLFVFFCFFTFRTIKKLIFPWPLKGQHPGSPPMLSLVPGGGALQCVVGRGDERRKRAGEKIESPSRRSSPLLLVVLSSGLSLVFLSQLLSNYK